MYLEKKLILILPFLIITSTSFSTMVMPVEKICPVCEQKIQVSGIVSYGGYIYDWPSKYDLIYWPDTEPEFIWICPYCGYAQVAKDFFKLSEENVITLKNLLGTQWSTKSLNEITPEIRFEQAILVNKHLGKSEDFWTWFNRILIHYYRDTDPNKAEQYAEQEIKLLEDNKGEFQIPVKNREYLLGEYNRLLGKKDLTRKHFFLALQFDALLFLRKCYLFVVAIQLLLFTPILIFAVSEKKKDIPQKIFVMIVSILFMLCSLVLFSAPYIMQKQQETSYYFDQIIQNRLNLISSESK